jgi:peptidoglycan-associated lipoprotein
MPMRLPFIKLMSVSFLVANAMRLAAVAVLAVGLSACASTNPTDPAALGGGALPGQDAGGIGQGGAGAPGSTQDFSVNVGDRIFFDTDSSEINAVGAATLDKQATWLAKYPTYSVTMQGHADERGTREYNFALGARRADAAKNYLVARGVTAGRISTISFGKERPVEVCDDISCWSKNRRVQTVLGSSGT